MTEKLTHEMVELKKRRLLWMRSGNMVPPPEKLTIAQELALCDAALLGLAAQERDALFTRALTHAVEAHRNDKRTPAERIRDGVSFIMGPGGDEGTRAAQTESPAQRRSEPPEHTSEPRSAAAGDQQNAAPTERREGDEIEWVLVQLYATSNATLRRDHLIKVLETRLGEINHNHPLLADRRQAPHAQGETPISARKFVSDWLWQEKYSGRLTKQMPWAHEYIEDAIQMCAEFGKQSALAALDAMKEK